MTGQLREELDLRRRHLLDALDASSPIICMAASPGGGARNWSTTSSACSKGPTSSCCARSSRGDQRAAPPAARTDLAACCPRAPRMAWRGRFIRLSLSERRLAQRHRGKDFQKPGRRCRYSRCDPCPWRPGVLPRAEGRRRPALACTNRDARAHARGRGDRCHGHRPRRRARSTHRVGAAAPRRFKPDRNRIHRASPRCGKARGAHYRRYTRANQRTRSNRRKSYE